MSALSYICGHCGAAQPGPHMPGCSVLSGFHYYTPSPAPLGTYERIAAALERIAAALERKP